VGGLLGGVCLGCVGDAMIVIEARYVGKFKVPEWGTWHEWRKYHLYEEMRARENYNRFQRQFRGLYEFQMVKV
jgi:hypothetical protein